jgi:hypothetical protein
MVTVISTANIYDPGNDSKLRGDIPSSSPPRKPELIPSDWLKSLESNMLSLLIVGLAKPSAIFSEISRPCSLLKHTAFNQESRCRKIKLNKRLPCKMFRSSFSAHLTHAQFTLSLLLPLSSKLFTFSRLLLVVFFMITLFTLGSTR